MADVRSCAVTAVLLTAVLAGCGSSSPPEITIAAAKTYRVVGFPKIFAARKPTRVTFHIDEPAGGALTKYRTGNGPHTGVHVIIVRSDLGVIVHKHPKPSASGEFDEEIMLPTSGRYRVVVDAYPAKGALKNFQLLQW